MSVVCMCVASNWNQSQAEAHVSKVPAAGANTDLGAGNWAKWDTSPQPGAAGQGGPAQASAEPVGRLSASV